ncbi:hypothetical protein LX36DRAFT_195518 [Colletotrichum falcatum]|nr:hypothetical protein LX36DRAFT_195518 [Colletotrichum falcatum]
MAPFHQCPWENCTHAHKEVAVSNISSPGDNLKLYELEGMTDSTYFPALSQEGHSDIVSVPEITTSISQGTSTKATSTIASLHQASEEEDPKTRCVHERSPYSWKLLKKRDQKCDLCANVLPKFVLRCARCNVKVCMMCGSRKGWIWGRITKNPPSNVRLWDSAH